MDEEEVMESKCCRCGKEIKKAFMNSKGLNNRCCQDCHSKILKAVNDAIDNGAINLRNDKLK